MHLWLIGILRIYLILEMNDPFNGLMRISDIPLRNALAPL